MRRSALGLCAKHSCRPVSENTGHHRPGPAGSAPFRGWHAPGCPGQGWPPVRWKKPVAGGGGHRRARGRTRRPPPRHSSAAGREHPWPEHRLWLPASARCRVVPVPGSARPFGRLRQGWSTRPVPRASRPHGPGPARRVWPGCCWCVAGRASRPVPQAMPAASVRRGQTARCPAPTRTGCAPAGQGRGGPFGCSWAMWGHNCVPGRARLGGVQRTAVSQKALLGGKRKRLRPGVYLQAV